MPSPLDDIFGTGGSKPAANNTPVKSQVAKSALEDIFGQSSSQPAQQPLQKSAPVQFEQATDADFKATAPQSFTQQMSSRFNDVFGLRKTFGKLTDYLSDTAFIQEAAQGLEIYKSETGEEAPVYKGLSIPKNVLAGLTDDPKSAIPYAGELYDIAQIGKLKLISDRAKAGTMSEEEQKWATDYIADLSETERRHQEDWGYTVGSTFKQSLQFMGEIVGAGLLAPTTAGGSIAGLVAQKGALKTAKIVAEKILTDKVARSIFTREIGQYAAGAGIRAGIASSTKIPKGAVERMIGSPISNEQGDFTGLAEDGQPLSEAITNSVSSALVEYSSEFSGGLLTGAGKGVASGAFNLLSPGIKDALVKSAFLKATLKANPSLPPSLLTQVLQKVGWNGVMSEWGEERVADAMYAALHSVGLSDQTFSLTPKQVIEELASFSFMGIVFRAAENSLAKAGKKQEVSMPGVDGAPPDGTPPPPDEPDIVDQIKEEIKTKLDQGITPEEITLELANDMSSQNAEAIVKESVIDQAKEQFLGVPDTRIKQEKQVSAQDSAPVTLAEKMGEEVLTKTPLDLQNEFSTAEEERSAGLVGIEQSIKDLEAQVKAAKAGSQEKKDLKIQLSQAKEELTKSDQTYTQRITKTAESFREFFSEYFTKAGVAKEEIANAVDELADHVTSPEKIEVSHSTAIKDIADEIVKGMKKEPVPKKAKTNKGEAKLYHATNENFTEFNPNANPEDFGTWFANNTSEMGGLANIHEVTLKPGTKLVTQSVWDKTISLKKYEDLSYQDLIKATGYRGIQYPNGDVQLFFPNEDTLDKTIKNTNNKNNESTNNNRGSDDNTGGVSEPLPDSGAKPRGTGGTTKELGKDDGERRPAKRGSDAGKRPSTRTGKRLTNEEVDQVISAVAEIGATGEVTLTGEITDEILEAANQYTPEGVLKEGRGVLDEYYTASSVVDMVKSLFDFPADPIKALEPSVGSGNFLYALPEMAKNDVRAFEINPTTAKIAKIFHNDAKVYNLPFEGLFVDKRGNKLPFEADYDLVIGNPPYGEHRGEYLGLGEQKHITKYEDYFIKRGLTVLKKGGYLAMVVPSSFLRGGENDGKIEISSLGILDMAFRLPNGVFDGTDVGTDIIVMHRRDSAKESTDIVSLVNDNYFKENLQNVLGEIKQKKNRFGKMEKYVDGTLEQAIAKFGEAKARTEAIKILDTLKEPKTEENIEAATASVEETGKGAEEMVKEAEKKVGKKTIVNKIVNKKTKTDVVVSLAGQSNISLSDAEIEHWKATKPDGSIDTKKVTVDKTISNYVGGQWFLDFNYQQGDIYEKLNLLEKDKEVIGKEQYDRQKAKLEAVKPTPESIDDIKLSPNVTFVKELSLGRKGDTGEELTLKGAFLDWLRTLPNSAFGDSSQYEVREYVNDEQVRGSDKDRNELVRVRRKAMADSLFTKFLREELTPDQKVAVELNYNDTFNFYHSPDYAKVPLFANINSMFDGKPFKMNNAQKMGVGRLVNTGVGLLAHEVGFGKTVSGVLAAHESMSRGWAKKPLVIAPNDNVYKQWEKTILELVPGAKINSLGNLGATYKGDLSSLTIPDNSFTLITYEGLKRLSFKDETYSKMADKFSYIADDLEGHKKTAREQAQGEEAVKGIAGKMKKGTRADLFFEDLGFDHITFDEVHNANHIVSKVKLEKGQASEYSRFTLRPSDLGMKTWLASQYIQDIKDGRNVNLLSATPFTNHPLEYYSILSLIADKSLRKMGFFNVNDFFGTFMEAEHEYEFKADGTYQKKTDIRRFKNYRQFRKLMDTYIDFRQEIPDIQRPRRIQKNYEIPKNELTRSLETMAQDIFKENENESGKGAKVLRAITELRKIAFSPYVSKFSTEIGTADYKKFVEDSPKLDVVMNIIRQNKTDRPDAGQIIYSEVGVESFPILKQYLVKELGFKPDEVEIISGATAKPKRLSIQESFNEGKIKILIGSDAISEGLNLQKNTTDMHLLSLPWNFTALRQVIGRGWRQGNKWQNIRINQYFIKDSVDVFLSQKLDNKQKRYENSIASNANEVDVGDVSYSEMKFDLIQDPEARAKLEIQAEKEKLNTDIIQQKAELAFATRKLEKINDLQKSIKNDTKYLEDEALKDEPSEYWVDRYTKDIARDTKTLNEEIERLKAKDINVDTLLETKAKEEVRIAELEAKVKTLDETLATRIKEIAASLPPREDYTPEMAKKLAADRAEENKDFYKLRETAREEVVTVEPTETPAGKEEVAVVKTPKAKVSKGGNGKDDRVLRILGDKKLSVSEKVNTILSSKQEGKEFKDVGERVSGSKKERAAIATVLENGDAAVIAEMISTLGPQAVADMLDKAEILDGAVKPDIEKDKQDGVPAFVAGWKLKVLNSIGKTPDLTTKRGSYSTYRNVPEDAVDQFLTAYADHLRAFVRELADVQTFEQALAFYETHSWEFATLELPEENTRTISIDTLGRTIKKAIADIRQYRYTLENIEKVKKILTEGVQKDEGWSDGKPRYLSLHYNLNTKTYPTKAEAEKALKDERKQTEEYLLSTEKQLNQSYDQYAPKKKTRSEDIDLSHGNFKPLERVERSQPDIPDEKIKPESLTTDAGFKSVQLGNYMDDATAKEHIRYTLGSVEDMSTLLGVDFPSLINQLGLSIAFGARGGGRFNAHFEPSHNIINITKGRGDGSFFHEIMHFLDWKTNLKGYRGKWSSAKTRWYRDNMLDQLTLKLMKTLNGDMIRRVKNFKPNDNSYAMEDENNAVLQMYRANKSFEEALKFAEGSSYPGRSYQDIADIYRKEIEAEVDLYNVATDFYKGALALGGNNTDSYWVQSHELLARAGQAYIEDKMIEAGMKNNYLTRTTIGDGTNSFIDKGYPQGEERKIFNKVFDEVFAELAKRFPKTEAKFSLTGGEKPVTQMTEAASYLADVKDRLKFDFDVFFVDKILAGYEVNLLTGSKVPIEAWGVAFDNSIALVKEMAKGTPRHELIHLTMDNLDKIPAFANEGITREKLLSAKAEQMGVKLTAQTERGLEEQIAKDFEVYLNDQTKAKGILRRFFDWLKKQLLRLARAIRDTNGDIIKDYYDILDEGRVVDQEMIRIENKGIIESFLGGDDDVLDVSAMQRDSRFKIKNEGDKRLSELQQSYNELENKVEELEVNADNWRTDLEKKMIDAADKAEVVEVVPENVKELAKFTTRKKPPVGQLTERGLQEVEQLEFANPEEAQQAVSDYLKRKVELVEIRNRMRGLRRQIAQAKRDKKMDAAALRDVSRKLKLRQHLLEQKDFYTGRGVKQGKKEQMRMIWKRGKALSDIQGLYSIGDARAKKIIANRRIHLMSEQEYNDFLVEFMNKAEILSGQLDAQDEVKAVVAEKQLNKWENLQQAMGLPSVSKMSEKQAEAFADTLGTYQFGDTFLTTRQIETAHRTNWGDIKTERELLDKVEQVMGTSRESLKELSAPGEGGKYTPWIKLARMNPMYNWLVSKRITADVQATQESMAIEDDINRLARASRRSRRALMSLKEKATELAVPTDDKVFDYIESTDKAAFAEREKLTTEEIAFGDYIINQYKNAYEYLQTEYGMKERQNYMTHARRSFFEAFKADGAMAALREVLASQKESEAAFKILDEKTGEVLAFEKFFKYSLQRSGQLVPSKNVARIAANYFRALATKRALDSFIPEAMLAVQAHKAITGTTAKGLTKDPTFEEFVKKFLNNAKGRKIDFITKQGSDLDIAFRTYISWLAVKYLGLNIASAIGNLLGDFMAISWELSVPETARGLKRTFANPVRNWQMAGKFQYFTGRNPFVEIFDTKYSTPQQLKQAVMSLMNLASFQSNKFFLRSLMTEEEFRNAVVSDARMTEIAKRLSRVKPNQFYVKSLAGSTTAGSAALQMGSWAVVTFNTVVSDATQVMKIIQDKQKGGYKEAFTASEAKSLYKFMILAGLAAVIVSLVHTDDDDKTLYGRTMKALKSNAQTLFQSLQFVANPDSYFLIAKDLKVWYTLAAQILTQEKYARDGVGYQVNDPKWINTAERLITPSVVRRAFPDELENALESMVRDGIDSDSFDAKQIVEEYYGEKIAEIETKKGKKEAKKYETEKVGQVKAIKVALTKYPDSQVLEIARTGDNNEKKVESMLKLDEELDGKVGAELTRLYNDRGLCANPAGHTGCFVSGALLKAYRVAKQKKK